MKSKVVALLYSKAIFLQTGDVMTNLEATKLFSLAQKAYEKGDVFSFVDEKYVLFPGFCDVHVHLREPGFVYKESIASGTNACARGGYTCVCSMPNLNPVPDSLENLQVQLTAIKNDACIKVLPYGAITKGERGEQLADMQDIAPYVCAFSDDGRGVQSDDMMKEAMLKAKSLKKMIVAHCEVNDLLEGGYIHKGEYALKHNHKGICSASEYEQIARDIELVKEIGCAYHVCHISTKESVDIIRQAKKEGVNVTCETAPHYLVMCEDDLGEEGRFKMNPPLRSKEDMLALIEGVKDGTIDMIATDHAPHSQEEKSRGLQGSPFGIVGIETAFAVLYTHLVKKGVITLEKLIDLIAIAPRKRFDIPMGEEFCLVDLSNEYTINSSEFLSKGKSTPFEGWQVFGRCKLTAVDGNIVFFE